MRRFILGTLVAGLVSAAPMSSNAGETAAPLGAGQLSPVEVQRRVEVAGYTNVKDIELDDGRYEVEAISHAGAEVDLHVDAASGEVVPETD